MTRRFSFLKQTLSKDVSCHQIFAVSRLFFRKQILPEDFLRQQICFSSANVFTLVNKTTLAPAHPFSRQPVS
jgi:hypothetical protein